MHTKKRTVRFLLILKLDICHSIQEFSKAKYFFSRRKAIIWQEIHHLWNHVSNLFTIEYAHKPVITLSTTKLPKSQWRAHFHGRYERLGRKKWQRFCGLPENSKWKKTCHVIWDDWIIVFIKKKFNGRVTAEHLADFINWFANGSKKESKNSWSCLSLLNQQVHLIGIFFSKKKCLCTHTSVLVLVSEKYRFRFIFIALICIHSPTLTRKMLSIGNEIVSAKGKMSGKWNANKKNVKLK